MQRLYGNSPIPEGFTLAEELVRRIQQGELSLEPSADSGWYEHQLWSIEPLILPDATSESARLRMTGRYREHLLALSA